MLIPKSEFDNEVNFNKMFKMKKRIIEENFFKVLMIVSSLFVLMIVIVIFVSIAIKGYSSLSISMITETPKGGYYLGKEGGILNAIIGSIYLGVSSTFLALIFAIPVTLYLNIYAEKKSKLSGFIRLCFDVLWGIPSIVYGAFGFIIMLMLGMGSSLLAGIITISFVIFPVMVRTIDESMSTVSKGLIDASYSLGATKFETGLKVVTKQIMPGIITAILIAFGRAIGDAAAVLFTAGYSDSIPSSFSEPAATLPLSIFFQLSSPIEEVRNRAYTAAIILVFLILIISLMSRIFTKKYNKFKI
jgi:phosphate transport system permease protein